ncbi:MAG: flagellar basal body P-ring protein FlgI [Spirochaetes bacterium]|nr:flagellar basal body P-ring protein FlgI [Spirochaetota bacterium]
MITLSIFFLQNLLYTKSELTASSLANLLKNLGLDVEEMYRTKNVAAVLITANLPPFARPGDRIDVMVSSIHNAKSLEGGVLVQSPLKGADNQIYAVAQGPLSVIGMEKGGKAIKTVARIVGGAIVERSVEPDVLEKDHVQLVLKEWDFMVAHQIISAVKELYPKSEPTIEKEGKIRLKIPENVVFSEFISKIFEIEVNPSSAAKIVINERDGTIVLGGEIKISESFVSREGISVKIEGKGTLLQKSGSAARIPETTSVKDLVDTLNQIGASTKDIISIIKALKDAGAIHAELIIK